MEASFNTNFSNVNIHTNDSKAAQMKALAFTQGNNVHFAPGQYNPHTSKGQELIGHEFTHVVQQCAGKVAPTRQAKGMSINDNPTLEHEADVMGKKAAEGKGVSGEITPVSESIQKQEVTYSPAVNIPNWSWNHALNEPQGSELVSGVGPLNIPNTFDVSFQEGGNITIILHDNESIRHEQIVGRDIPSIRNYLTKNYNWNAIIRIMKYVSENIEGINYSIPTNISGTIEDNELIMPEECVAGIVEIQLQEAVEASNSEITADNIDMIVSLVDGAPGSNFASIMGEESQNTLRDEAGNTTMQKENGDTIDIPDFESDSEESLYNFMRDLTLARNGLWSDEENIVNLTGLRRELEISEEEDHAVQWNDTMATSWIETDEQGNQVKNCRHYTATTEPGNRDIKRMITPQTATVLLGLHKNRQPAGRLQSPLIKGSDNDNNKYCFDENNEAGMNFHPGGVDGYGGIGYNGQASNNPLSLIPGNYGATIESSFNNQVVLVEIYSILSKWGENMDKSAYYHLIDKKNEADTLLQSSQPLTTDQIQSQTDFNRITELFTTLDTLLTNTSLSSNQIQTRLDFIKNDLFLNNKLEKEHLDENDATSPNIESLRLNDRTLEISRNVNNSSWGCQVIYGGKSFYDYWMETTNKTSTSNQRRWYYTLIDLTTQYNSISTQEIIVNE